MNLGQTGGNSGLRGVFEEGIGRVTSKQFKLDASGIPVYIPYP